MTLSTACWKYLVLTYCVLFAMSAVVLFGLGGYLLYQLFVYHHFVGVSVQFPALLLVVVAVLSCSVAWMGWKASWSLHRFHIIMFGLVLLLIEAAEFGCFVWSLVMYERLDLDVKSAVDKYFHLAFVDKDQHAASRWDRIQYQMQCCGVGGPPDYSAVHSMPYSCCGQGPLSSGPAAYVADCAAIFQRGCTTPLYEHARRHVLAIAMAALAAAILQGCGVFCAFCLAKSAQNNRRQSIRTSSVRNSALHAEDSLLNASAPLKY